MTKLLERAMNEIGKLPDHEQDALAAWILEELRLEREWSSLLAKSSEALERLADEALAEHRAGRTRALDPERL